MKSHVNGSYCLQWEIYKLGPNSYNLKVEKTSTIDPKLPDKNQPNYYNFYNNDIPIFNLLMILKQNAQTLTCHNYFYFNN